MHVCMYLFLVTEAWDPLQHIRRQQRLAEQRGDEADTPPARVVNNFFNVNDIFNRYYSQLLDGLDPDSAEALKYCRYIRNEDKK